MSSQQAQLRDLPEVDESPRVNICSPKLIILTILSIYFVSQNVYNFYMHPPPQVTSRPQPQPEVDEWQNFMQMWDRFQGYVIVSVVGFAVFWYLRKLNNKYDDEEFQKVQKQEKEVEEREQKLQAEREDRIIRKLEEQEREAEEKQLRMAQLNQPKQSQQFSAQKKAK